MPVCKSCQFTNQRTFNSEINIHFNGLKGLDKPTVWVFPKLLVCFNCGFTEFEIEEDPLRLLKKGSEAQESVA